MASAAVIAGIAFAVPLWPYRSAASRESLDWAVGAVAGLGPWPFFAALAILPLFWAPVSPFLLVAPVFGTAWALAGSLVALAINMSLAWLVAGKLFRPFFERLVARFGYRAPELSRGGMYGAALLLRLTPGVPFPLQNYLLGLARMPFLPYIAVSLPANALPVVGMILLGEAVIAGQFGRVLGAVVAILLIMVILRYARLRLQKRALERELGEPA